MLQFGSFFSSSAFASAVPKFTYEIKLKQRKKGGGELVNQGLFDGTVLLSCDWMVIKKH